MIDQHTPAPGREDPWSVSTHDLHQALLAYRPNQSEAVVATVVDVEGSAYRRPGAKMLIGPGSDSFGAITAGCLEGPVKDLATRVIDSGAPIVETFDLMEDDGEWGLGLGCNGIIDILLEPLDSSWDPLLEHIESRSPIGTATVVDPAGSSLATGDRVVFDGSTMATVPTREDIPAKVWKPLQTQLEALGPSGGSTTISIEIDGEAVGVFLEWLTPAPDLLLFGSQNDIHPVSKVGRQAGFRVVVASPRGARADAEEFAHAHQVTAVHPMELPTVIDNPERTFAVLMSHNLLEDRLALEALLDTSVDYIGLMGPRERFEELREDYVEDMGKDIPPEDLDRIATPVGLDLGGGEPIQIALSIVAEALALHNDRSGDRLKDLEGPIHKRISPASEATGTN